MKIEKRTLTPKKGDKEEVNTSQLTEWGGDPRGPVTMRIIFEVVRDITTTSETG